MRPPGRRGAAPVGRREQRWSRRGPCGPMRDSVTKTMGAPHDTQTPNHARPPAGDTCRQRPAARAATCSATPHPRRRFVFATLLACALAAASPGSPEGVPPRAHGDRRHQNRRPASPGCQQAATRPQSRSPPSTTASEVVIEDWTRRQSQLGAVDDQLSRSACNSRKATEARQQQAAWARTCVDVQLADTGLLDELLNGGSLTDAAARLELLKMR